MKSGLNRSYSSVIIMLFGGLVLATIVVHSLWSIKVPKHLFLSPLSSGKQELSFCAPKGDHYNIVIGLRQAKEDATSRLKGAISLMRATQEPMQLDFDTLHSTTGNWLHSENLSAYIITLSPNSSMSFEAWMHGKGPIKVEMQTSSSNVAEASLWLFYLEPWVYQAFK